MQIEQYDNGNSFFWDSFVFTVGSVHRFVLFSFLLVVLAAKLSTRVLLVFDLGSVVGICNTDHYTFVLSFWNIHGELVIYQVKSEKGFFKSCNSFFLSDILCFNVSIFANLSEFHESIYKYNGSTQAKSVKLVYEIKAV